MTSAAYDVLGIGNAIVDVISRADEAFLGQHGLGDGEGAVGGGRTAVGGRLQQDLLDLHDGQPVAQRGAHVHAELVAVPERREQREPTGGCPEHDSFYSRRRCIIPK